MSRPPSTGVRLPRGSGILGKLSSWRTGVRTARQRNVRPVNRTVMIGAASVVVLAVFAALAVGIVADRRPLDDEVTRSFGKVVSAAAGNAATVGAPACSKVSVDFYDCTAAVTPRARGAQ